MGNSNYGASYFHIEWERCVDGYDAMYKDTRLEIEYIKNLDPIGDMASMILEDITITPRSDQFEIVKDHSNTVPPLQRQLEMLNIAGKDEGKHEHAILNYLGWAREFGLLTHQRKAESITIFYSASNAMRTLLELIDNKDYEEVMNFMNSGRVGRNTIHLTRGRNDGYKISHHPDSFLAGMYIQLAEMIQFGLNHEKCAYCSDWYLPKRRKQADRNNFCSSDHEKKYNNEKVKQGRKSK